jgi:hypothetical protein
MYFAPAACGVTPGSAMAESQVVTGLTRAWPPCIRRQFCATATTATTAIRRTGFSSVTSVGCAPA